MSKFRIKMKLQGLELEIEGSRDDAALISQNIGQQMAGMLQPVANIIDGEVNRVAPQAPALGAGSVEPIKKGRRRRQAGTPGPEGDANPALDFRHEPDKYGNPKQHWKTAQKALWLLYVVKETLGTDELSTQGIVKTFNKHFRQSGTVTSSNVSRDLGRLKTGQTPTPVSEDATKTPSAWFLTDEGRKRAQALVAEALGQQPPPAA